MHLILASVLLLQGTPAQSAADKLEAALKKFGDRSYLFLENGVKVGTVTLKTRIEKEGGLSVAIFEDGLTLTREGQKSTLTMTEKASTDRLRLISRKEAFKAGDTEDHWLITVKGMKASMTDEGRNQTLDVTESTVGEQGVIRLVCAAEQKEGVTFNEDVLSLTSEMLQPGHSFRCFGKERVEIGGKKLDAFKWEEKGEWKYTRKIGDKDVPGTSRVRNTYWVSPDGYLLRSNSGGRVEVVLDVK